MKSSILKGTLIYTMANTIIKLGGLVFLPIMTRILTTEEFYNKPANLFVAKFIGSPTMNIINGTIKDGMFVSDSGIVKIKPDERLKAYEGQKISVGIRSERFLSEKNNENSISAKIDVIEMLGKDKALYVKLEDNTQLIITVPSYYKYEIGETHNFTFDTDALHYFNEEGNRI